MTEGKPLPYWAKAVDERRMAEEPPSKETLGKNVLDNLVRGKYSLARTFWLYNLLIPFVLWFVMGLINLIGFYVPMIRLFNMFLLPVYLLYSILAIIGLSIAITRYRGSIAWKVLAMIYFVLQVLGFAMQLNLLISIVSQFLL